MFLKGRSPNLVVRDVEIVKSMVIKDFSHFVDHGFTVSIYNKRVDDLRNQVYIFGSLLLTCFFFIIDR
jgi:hypothetical protein